MPKTDKDKALADAYRTINEADAETEKQAKRLAKLHLQTGESEEQSTLVINEILESGPGAADRLRATADAVAQLWGIKE